MSDLTLFPDTWTQEQKCYLWLCKPGKESTTEYVKRLIEEGVDPQLMIDSHKKNFINSICPTSEKSKHSSGIINPIII